MNEKIVTINIPRKSVFNKWKDFLTAQGITNFSQEEVTNIDSTIAIFDSDHQLQATGSVAGNVLKYIAVAAEQKEGGAVFNQIVTTLLSELAQRQIFHVFVFTKPQYSESFQHVGFSELARSKFGVILEEGDSTVKDYLSSIPKIFDQDNKKVSAIVMNANPFTYGHHFLAQTAAKENDLVYVFVVNTNASLFNTKERMQMVQEGLKDLANVKVVNGSDYMVSYATFPAYFLKTEDEAIQYQTTLDARIFRDQIAPPLNITKRYLGTEPVSHTTGIYNQVLKKELPPAVKPVIIERKHTSSGRLITATEVRAQIKEGKIDEIRKLVPQSTFKFIEDNEKELTTRIKKGMKISGN